MKLMQVLQTRLLVYYPLPLVLVQEYIFELLISIYQVLLISNLGFESRKAFALYTMLHILLEYLQTQSLPYQSVHVHKFQYNSICN